MDEFIYITIKDIPDSFKDTFFYDSLDKDDETRFEINKKCFKTDFNINNKEDLENFVNTLRFWGFKYSIKLNIKTVGYLVEKVYNVKSVLKEMNSENMEVFNFLKLDFEIIKKYSEDDFMDYKKSMFLCYGVNITEKQLFKIYCISIMATENNYFYSYLYNQITNHIEQKLLVYVCVCNNDKKSLEQINRLDLLKNDKVWRKVLNGAKDEVLEYMLNNKIVFGKLKKEIEYLKLTKNQYEDMYDFDYMSQKSINKIKEQSNKYNNCIKNLKNHERNVIIKNYIILRKK